VTEADPAIRVMVVDDHPMWREGVSRDLAEAGYEVVAATGEGAQAVRIAQAVRPQVVVLDLQLPDLSGVAVMQGLAAAGVQARVLVLSASGEHQDVLDAVKAGAAGYLVKSAGRAEFLDAVRRTADGDAPRLTERETEILRLVAKGLSYRQIAERLVVSHRTVQNHVQNTLNKLQLHNRVELVRYAIERGLDDEG